MTIWEKAVVSMQKGARKITLAAATVSERVKAEIALVRLRIRMDEVQSRIDELHRNIGRKVETLKNSDAMPKASEQLLKEEDIDASLNELVERKKEIEELKHEMRQEQDAFKPVTKHREDGAE